jgi:DNA-binding NtrC family response regulator
LANTIQKALIFNPGTPITPEVVSQAISGKMPGTALSGEGKDEAIRAWARERLLSGVDDNLFDKVMDQFSSVLVSEALALTGGNRSQSAKLLGLSRPTLHSKIEKYGLKFETSVKKE